MSLDIYVKNIRGARGVMVIIIGTGHGNQSSNTEQGNLHFTVDKKIYWTWKWNWY